MTTAATTLRTKPVPSPFSGPKYHENSRGGGRDGEDPCAICGKLVKHSPGTKWAEVVDGGARFATIDEKADENDSGYMGGFPVGNDCARRFPDGYLRTGF
jgi:hypothetical protein